LSTSPPSAPSSCGGERCSAWNKLERLAMEEVKQQLVQYTVPPGYLGKGEGR
jgi:hypothetical protein